MNSLRVKGTCSFLRWKIISVLIGLWFLVWNVALVKPAFAKDTFPASRITWVTPYKPGGGYDLLARGIGPYLTKYLRERAPDVRGGDLVFKNEPANSGLKAYNTVYNAKPDGYTIGGFDAAIVTETLTSKLDLDLSKFTYLLRIMTTNRILVTHKAGFANWKEMLSASKIKELKWGTSRFGNSLHVDSVIVKEAVGIPTRFIPWSGTAECMNALIRRDIQVALVSEDSVRALLSAGEIKPLVSFTDQSEYPGVPSIKELGYPDLAEKVGGHRFVIAPPALPKELAGIWIATFKKALNDPAFKAWAKKVELSVEPIYGEDAERVARDMFKFYQQDLKPLLLKYLQ